MAALLKERVWQCYLNGPCFVTLIWISPDGEVMRSKKPWKRARTDEAVAVWVTDYIDSLLHGYQPPGYAVAPVPHAARVICHGCVLAEWSRPLTIDELKLIDQKELARAG